jgi:hypothetical protein
MNGPGRRIAAYDEEGLVTPQKKTSATPIEHGYRKDQINMSREDVQLRCTTAGLNKTYAVCG